jgi:16S rRNA (guanine527-N7)-methyltransferase
MSHSEQVKVFKQSLATNVPTYGVRLPSENQTTLGAYYELLLRWNERLHLVAPCSPEEFATKHVLESLMLTAHFPEGARVVDVGSGAGLPIIPCMIVRPEITATLIESSQKKSVFLREALKTIGALKRATIVSKPFEESPAPAAGFVTCRALDDFSSKLSSLIHWAPQGSTLFLFGGNNLHQRLTALNHAFNESLLPGSEQRFLFEVKKTVSTETR